MKPLNGLMSCAVVHVILGGLLALLPTDKAFSQADFYSGKTITIIRGGGPGGSGEFQTRSLMRVLEKYIPGRRTLVFKSYSGRTNAGAAGFRVTQRRACGPLNRLLKRTFCRLGRCAQHKPRLPLLDFQSN